MWWLIGSRCDCPLDGDEVANCKEMWWPIDRRRDCLRTYGDSLGSPLQSSNPASLTMTLWVAAGSSYYAIKYEG